MGKDKTYWINKFYEFLVQQNLLFDYIEAISPETFESTWKIIQQEYDYERKSGWNEDKSKVEYCAFNLINIGVFWRNTKQGYEFWEQKHLLWIQNFKFNPKWEKAIYV